MQPLKQFENTQFYYWETPENCTLGACHSEKKQINKNLGLIKPSSSLLRQCQSTELLFSHQDVTWYYFIFVASLTGRSSGRDVLCLPSSPQCLLGPAINLYAVEWRYLKVRLRDVGVILPIDGGVVRSRAGILGRWSEVEATPECALQ